jgi:hypothetical protein
MKAVGAGALQLDREGGHAWGIEGLGACFVTRHSIHGIMAMLRR